MRHTNIKSNLYYNKNLTKKRPTGNIKSACPNNSYDSIHLEKPKPYVKTIDLSNNDVIKLADLQELPILVDLNSSTESASSASSSGSTNTTDSHESGNKATQKQMERWMDVLCL